jgi:hypothetical protein
VIKVIFLSEISSLIPKLWLLGRRENRQDERRGQGGEGQDNGRGLLRGRQGMAVKNDPLPPGSHAGFVLEVLKWKSIWLPLLENM